MHYNGVGLIFVFTREFQKSFPRSVNLPPTSVEINII